MRYGVGPFFFALIFLMIGAVLLANGESASNSGEEASIVVGAAFLTLGFIIMWTVVKDWWEWKKEYQKYRGE